MATSEPTRCPALLVRNGRDILANLRKLNRTPREGVDLRPLLKARSYADSAGEPMTIRRAKALSAVLEHSPIEIRPGECLVGTMYPLINALMPDGVTADHLGKAAAEVQAIGERNFRTNSDHMAPSYAMLLREGIGGLRNRAVASLAERNEDVEQDFLKSVIVALDGVSTYIRRYADLCREKAGEEDEFHSGMAKMLGRYRDRPADLLPRRSAVDMAVPLHLQPGGPRCDGAGPHGPVPVALLQPRHRDGSHLP